jgi:TonB family protein
LKIRVLTIAAVLCLFSLPAPAQSDSAWTELSPEGESFRISMPAKATSYEYAAGAIKGRRYQSFAEGSWYTVWSLQNSIVRSQQESDEYLDAGGELVWHTLLQPARDSLTDVARAMARMTYVKELSGKVLPGREYFFVIGDAKGAAQIYLAYQRVFVLMVLDSPTSPWHRMRFFDSFTVSPELAKLQFAPAEPSTAKRTDDNERIFSGREVTKKARVLSKPEPTYTESARQYAIQGTVVLRAVFSKDGEVTNLHVVSKLPHGLTRRAIEAARGIKFVPAEVDGRPVSMWMELQYNFNLY